MWIGLNDGWLSVVKNENDEETLLVRARKKEHLTNVFPHCDWFTDKNADYRYRAYIDRKEVAQQITERILNIEYPNFKASVKNSRLKAIYNDVWTNFFYGYGDE
jgi:hypothetical protein